MPSPVVFGSALDVNAIVGQLMTAERKPLALLAREQGMVQSQVSSWGRVKSALSALRDALRDLKDAERLRAYKAAVADAAVAAASAGAGASAGVHTLQVLALAQAHRLHSAPVASANDTAGGGTLTFEYGTWDSGTNTFTPDPAKPAHSVAIAAGSSFAAVGDAVNAAGNGVAASLVYDGSAYRLVFTAKETGAGSSLRVRVSDDDGTNTDTNGLSRLAFDPAAAAGAGKNLLEVQAAEDARLRLDGVEMRRSSNSVADAIAGVTLGLRAAGGPTEVRVTPDTETVKKAIEKFVSGYNEAHKVLRELTAYDAGKKQAGLLQGDVLAGALTARMRSVLGASLEAFSGRFRSLAEVGVTFQKDGSLALDAARLAGALDTAFADLAGLFACTGTASHPCLALRGWSARTRAGTYAVEVTTIATRGTLAGSAPAGLTITAGVNDTLGVTVNGVAATVVLAAGTYASAAALATEVQAKVNAAPALAAANARVSVTASGGVLTLASERYGAESTVAVNGSAAENLFGANPNSTAGVDVAGTIGGAAAIGRGRVLTGAGNGAEGLQVEILASAPGALGTMQFARGHADQLDAMLEELLASGGGVASRTEGLNARLKALDARKAETEERLAEVERRYRAQFVALDAMLQRMNSTSNFLAQQLAALPGVRSR